MKLLVCLVFFFGVCYSSQIGYKNQHREKYGDRINNHQTYKDYHNHIITPCSLDDLNCIRRVFAHNSKCKPVEGPAPDPYMLQRLDMPVPQANLTVSLMNAQVIGLNEWKINNFFMNKATDKLVLEVIFDRIVVASPETKITYHRKGKEPIEEIDYSIIEYYGLSFTLTIPLTKDLQLSNGHIFTYVVDASPLYTLGSAVARNTDAGFINSVAVLLGNLDITMREVWQTQGSVFFPEFLQSSICDFRYH